MYYTGYLSSPVIVVIYSRETTTGLNYLSLKYFIKFTYCVINPLLKNVHSVGIVFLCCGFEHKLNYRCFWVVSDGSLFLVPALPSLVFLVVLYI